MGSRIRGDSQLFEVFVEAHRSICEDGQADTKLVFVYPRVQQDILNSVTKFVFPFDPLFISHSVDCFTFVLTDGDGTFKFGFCRLSNNSGICHCLISYYPWFGVFYPLLNFLTDLKKSADFRLFLEVIDSLLSIFHFPPGKRISSKVEPHFEFDVPDMNQLMTIPTSINLTEYFCAVDVKHMMEIFASTLLERRIIVVSRRLSRLTACVHTAAAFLFPFHWQHIFIPILPSHLLDYCSAPMPFLIGVHSSLWSKINKEELGDVLILDADDNAIHSSFNDLNRFPQVVVSQLKKNLAKGNSCCSKGDLIPRAFLKLLANLFGGYRVAFKTEHGKIVFDKDAFVMTRPSAYHPFLRYALQLQIFQQFIEERLVLLNSGKTFCDVFEEEIKNMDDQERQKGKNSKLAEQKFKKLINKADKSRFTSFLENVMGGCSSSTERDVKPRKSQTPNLPKKIFQRFPRKLSVNFLGDKMKNDARRQLSSSSSSDGLLFKHLECSLPLTKDILHSLGDMDFQQDGDAEQQFNSISLASSFEAFNILSQEDTKAINYKASHSLEDVTCNDGTDLNSPVKSSMSPQIKMRENVEPYNVKELKSSTLNNGKAVSQRLQNLIDLYEKKEDNKPQKTGTLNPPFPGTYIPPHLGPSTIAERRADLLASTEQWKRNYRFRNISDISTLESNKHFLLMSMTEVEGEKTIEKNIGEPSLLYPSMQNGHIPSDAKSGMGLDSVAGEQQESGSKRVASSTGLSRRLAFKVSKSQSSSESQRGSMYRLSFKESFEKNCNNDQKQLSPLSIGDNDSLEEENSADDIYSTPPTYQASQLVDSCNSSKYANEPEPKNSNIFTSDANKLTSDDNLSINSRASSYSSILSDCNDVHKLFPLPKHGSSYAPLHFQGDKSAAYPD